jgi:excisionase family DNA binding protein
MRAYDPAERLIYSVPEAGRLLGLGRNAAYAAAQRGDIPTIRIGKLLLVPKARLHRMLGLTRETALAAELGESTASTAEVNKKESEP